jgi:hypothetical protein
MADALHFPCVLVPRAATAADFRTGWSPEPDKPESLLFVDLNFNVSHDDEPEGFSFACFMAGDGFIGITRSPHEWSDSRTRFAFCSSLARRDEEIVRFIVF